MHRCPGRRVWPRLRVWTDRSAAVSTGGRPGCGRRSRPCLEKPSTRQVTAAGIFRTGSAATSRTSGNIILRGCRGRNAIARGRISFPAPAASPVGATLGSRQPGHHRTRQRVPPPRRGRPRGRRFESTGRTMTRRSRSCAPPGLDRPPSPATTITSRRNSSGYGVGIALILPARPQPHRQGVNRTGGSPSPAAAVSGAGGGTVVWTSTAPVGSQTAAVWVLRWVSTPMTNWTWPSRQEDANERS